MARVLMSLGAGLVYGYTTSIAKMNGRWDDQLKHTGASEASGWRHCEGIAMVMAVVLINVDSDETKRVAAQIADLAGISEVYSVAGKYDLVAIMRVKDNESVADLMSDQIRKVNGVTRTETLIAFRAYSKYDLESLFNLD